MAPDLAIGRPVPAARQLFALARRRGRQRRRLKQPAALAPPRRTSAQPLSPFLVLGRWPWRGPAPLAGRAGAALPRTSTLPPPRARGPASLRVPRRAVCPKSCQRRPAVAALPSQLSTTPRRRPPSRCPMQRAPSTRGPFYPPTQRQTDLRFAHGRLVPPCLQAAGEEMLVPTSDSGTSSTAVRRPTQQGATSHRGRSSQGIQPHASNRHARPLPDRPATTAAPMSTTATSSITPSSLSFIERRRH